MGDIAGVDAAPDVAHFEDSRVGVEFGKDDLFEGGMGGAREDA